MMQAQVEAENPNVLPPRPPPGPPPGMSDTEFKRVEERRKSLPESQRPLPPTGWNLVRKVQMANQTVQALGAPPVDMRLMPADPLKMRQRTVVLETQGKLGMALADRFRHEEHEALVVTSILPDSAAGKHGVEVGDVVDEINGMPSGTLAEAMSAIKAFREKGEPLTLKLSSPSFRDVIGGSSEGGPGPSKLSRSRWASQYGAPDQKPVAAPPIMAAAPEPAPPTFRKSGDSFLYAPAASPAKKDTTVDEPEKSPYDAQRAFLAKEERLVEEERQNFVPPPRPPSDVPPGMTKSEFKKVQKRRASTVSYTHLTLPTKA